MLALPYSVPGSETQISRLFIRAKVYFFPCEYTSARAVVNNTFKILLGNHLKPHNYRLSILGMTQQGVIEAPFQPLSLDAKQRNYIIYKKEVLSLFDFGFFRNT